MKQVLVVYKKSSLDMMREDPQKIRSLRRQSPQIFDELTVSHQIHQNSLKQVLHVLKKNRCEVAVEYRSRVELVAKADLVVTVGGDGTFLEAARHVRYIPVVAVNSDPQASVAYFSVCQAREFATIFPLLGSRSYPLRQIPRLEICVNGKSLGRPVLNDVLVAHRCPAATTRLTLKQGRKSLFFKCSGIWVATGPGSSAAIGSAGGYPLGFFSHRWQYLVREPYGQVTRTFCRQILQRTSRLKLECGSLQTRLYLDGPHRSLALEIGDVIEVSQGNFPLQIFCRRPLKRPRS